MLVLSNLQIFSCALLPLALCTSSPRYAISEILILTTTRKDSLRENTKIHTCLFREMLVLLTSTFLYYSLTYFLWFLWQLECLLCDAWASSVVSHHFYNLVSLPRSSDNKIRFFKKPDTWLILALRWRSVPWCDFRNKHSSLAVPGVNFGRVKECPLVTESSGCVT